MNNMNNSTNAWFLLGAAVVGLVSAAGVYLIEQFRHDKRRHAFSQDLARLDGQLTSLRQELEVLRQLQKDRHNNSLHSKPNRRKLKSSALSVTSTDDYVSAVDPDSSDLEFYDLSSDEEISLEKAALDKELEICDQLMKNESVYEEVLEKLETLNNKHPDNEEILWRLAKAIKIQIKETPNVEDRKKLIDRGVEICTNAIECSPENANCHKWLAIFIGMRCEFQPTKEKILSGHLYSQHIIQALELTPEDSTLHHLLGRYKYEVAKLSWLEKTVASTLFAEMPSYSYEDALVNFFEAERLNSEQWKENRLYIAKCELAAGKTDSAIEWLHKANNATSEEEETVLNEIKNLLEKYKQQ